jgi:hypothetical protein
VVATADYTTFDFEILVSELWLLIMTYLTYSTSSHGGLRETTVSKKILKNVKFFKHSEAMSAILDEGKGHQTQF